MMDNELEILKQQRNELDKKIRKVIEQRLKSYIGKFVYIEIKGIPSCAGILHYNKNSNKYRCQKNKQWCTIQKISDVTDIEEVTDEVTIEENRYWTEKIIKRRNYG